jgi:hypothetical protein
MISAFSISFNQNRGKCGGTANITRGAIVEKTGYKFGAYPMGFKKLAGLRQWKGAEHNNPSNDQRLRRRLFLPIFYQVLPINSRRRTHKYSQKLMKYN